MKFVTILTDIQSLICACELYWVGLRILSFYNALLYDIILTLFPEISEENCSTNYPLLHNSILIKILVYSILRLSSNLQFVKKNIPVDASKLLQNILLPNITDAHVKEESSSFTPSE